jgi:hypothetical protein
MMDLIQITTNHIRAKFRHLKASAIRREHLLTSADRAFGNAKAVNVVHQGEQVKLK